MKVRVMIHEFELDIDDLEIEGLNEDRLGEHIEEVVYNFIENGHNHLDYYYTIL